MKNDTATKHLSISNKVEVEFSCILPENGEWTTQMNCVNGEIESGSTISICNDVTEIASMSLLALGTTMSVVKGIVVRTKRGAAYGIIDQYIR